MDIESGFDEKTLRELEAGDVFFYDGEVYIKTDNEFTAHDNMCVNLKTGSIELFTDLESVGTIKDAVLKIGGYYK